MTKQEFTELFEVVQQYHEQSRELGEMLHKTLNRHLKPFYKPNKNTEL